MVDYNQNPSLRSIFANIVSILINIIVFKIKIFSIKRYLLDYPKTGFADKLCGLNHNGLIMVRTSIFSRKGWWAIFKGGILPLSISDNQGRSKEVNFKGLKWGVRQNLGVPDANFLKHIFMAPPLLADHYEPT